MQSDPKYSFNTITSISLTSDEINVYGLVEGVMNVKISDMITECCKLKYDKNNKLAKVDFSRIAITDETCKLLCSSLFSDTSTLTIVEQLDFSSSRQFSLTCAPIIIELFQYCAIKHLVLPNKEILDKFSETILKDYHARKKIVNFTKKIPLTINIETEVEEDEKDGITYSIVANTYLQDYEITTELFNHYEDEIINQITTSHTFILLDCLKRNKLDTILSILYTKSSYFKICVFELRLTNNVLDASVNHLKMLKKEIYRDRLRYVLASDSKIVAYNAKRFQILQALHIKPRICDLEITHCIISKGSLKLMALTLIGKFNLLKNIKVIACKIKDRDFYDFCDILSGFPKKSTIILSTMDFSHNLLTSSSIGAILKLLECSVIETLIVSNNSINDTALTDAIYQLARYRWNKICNASSSKPLVVINLPTSCHYKLSIDKVRYATIFHMNCEILKTVSLDYCSKAKKIYFLNSIGDLRKNLSTVNHCLSSEVKVVIYEKDLNDEVMQEVATSLKMKCCIHMNFILTSRTTLLARGSSYHHVTPLLESNPLISTLQLNNFAMQFPYKCCFIRNLTSTHRNWESFDLSGCNIRDAGCLNLQTCFVLSKSTIRYLNLMYNNLSCISAAAVANIILNCDVKKINISSNTLRCNEVINALSCFTANVLSVEIISGDSTAILLSNTDPKFLPNQLWSSKSKIQLCIMHYLKFCHVYSILSSLHCTKLSEVILYNNCLTLDGIVCIIKKLSLTNLCIQEAHIQYNSKFIDTSLESFWTNLLDIDTNDNILLPFSSLTFSKMDYMHNKICTYDYKIMIDSVETSLVKLIQQQISTTFVAIKLSNCHIVHSIAIKLASFITSSLVLRLFELSYSYIQESDLKVILRALKSNKLLIIFTIKSINCFIEDTAEDIGGIIARNSSIMYLNISNCDMKQSSVLKITRCIKELRELKQLNLSGIPLTYESLNFALKGKSTLEELNLSHCKLQNPEILIISSALKEARFTNVNLSHNNISDYSANRLISLLNNRSINTIEMSNCNLQEKGISCIINALKHKSIKYLNFSGNRITDLLATELSAGISNNPYITKLDLSNCSLQEIGTEEIFTSIKDHVLHLTSFKASSIVSTEETVSLFGAILDNNKSIEELTLHDCNCKRIFSVVKKTVSTLQFLDISSSAISFNNLISIVVANNTTIKHLNISNCDVQGEPDVHDNNLIGVFLEYLDFSRNRIKTAFANFISKLISANYKLKHLDIANCIIEEDELIKITNSLTLLTTLKYLNCSNIVMSANVASILSKAIANNVHLQHLDISFCNLTELTYLPIANAIKQGRLLKIFKINSNHVALDFKIFGNLLRNVEVISTVTDSLAEGKLVPSQSSIKESEKVPILVDHHEYSTDTMNSSTHSSMEEYATISVGTHKVAPMYCIIPKSYESPDANVYAPLYMIPKKRVCDCSSCSNGDITSTHKILTWKPLFSRPLALSRSHALPPSHATKQIAHDYTYRSIYEEDISTDSSNDSSS